MFTRAIIMLTLSFLVFAAPAAATDGTAQIPEGSSLTLFALGLAGVLIGRRFAMRKGDDGTDKD